MFYIYDGSQNMDISSKITSSAVKQLLSFNEDHLVNLFK